MPSFAKQLYIYPYGEFDFLFTPVYTPCSERFHVMVMDSGRELCRFTMQPVLHYWMITDTQEVPVWVEGMERELEKIIKQHYHPATPLAK